MFLAFGFGSAGGLFPVFPGQWVGGDRVGERAGGAGAVAAVRAAGAGGEVVADEGQHGGEADGGEAGPGGGRGPGRHGGDHVVYQEQGPGLLPGRRGRAPAQGAADAADGLL